MSKKHNDQTFTDFSSDDFQNEDLLELDDISDLEEFQAPFADFLFEDLEKDEDGFEVILESKAQKIAKEEKKAIKKKAKKKKENAVKSLVHSEDDLVLFDEFSQEKTHAQINEMDLEDLIALELSSDLPDTVKSPVYDKPKEESIISWFTIFYIAITAFCLFIAHRYNISLNTAISNYENDQPEAYVTSLLETFRDSETAGKYFHFPEITYSEFDDSQKLALDYYSYLSSASLTFERSNLFTVTEPVFDFYANGQPFGTIYLNSIPDQLYLGKFQTYDYFCKQVDVTISVNPATYYIKAPSSFHVYVNGIELSSKYYTGTKEDIPELTSYKDYVDIPYYVSYELKDLIFTPDIYITTPNGQEVTYMNSGNQIIIPAQFDHPEFPATLLIYTDILTAMESYSNYLSGDLSGKDGGFASIEKYLLKDTVFYEKAKGYVSDGTIPTIEDHTLPEYVFSSRSISDYTLYSDDFFSCTVTLEKNVQLANGTFKTYTENYQCFYIKDYQDPDLVNDLSYHWKIINIIRQ